jgi:hypothetical protein
MKKIVILLTSLLIVSCSNEEKTVSPPKTLSSIKRSYYYPNGQLSSFDNMNFLNEKLINIKYSGTERNRDEYTYNEQGIVSQILYYNLDGYLALTKTYSYDTMGRIIGKSIKILITDTGETINTKLVFTYLTDKIIVNTISNGRESSQEILLNSSNKIIKQIITPAIYSTTYQYENGDVTSSKTNFANSESVESYSYNTLKNNNNYRQYIFGNEWKLNDYLDNFNSGSTYFVYLQSQNLISEYTSSPTRIDNLSDKMAIFKRKFTYTFNDKKEIYKETQMYSRTIDETTENLFKEEFIYTYK